MWGWIVFGGLFAAIAALGFYRAARFGRGSREGAVEDPANGVQTTTSRKLWP